MIEYVTAGLGITTGIGVVLAFVYRRGRSDGIDSACEKRIKDQIKSIKVNQDNHAKEDKIVHDNLFKEINKVDSKIDTLSGKMDVIKDIVTRQL